MPVEMAWHAKAACSGMDRNLFFEATPGAPMSETGLEAKKVCRGCPVRERCLEWALKYTERGVWGGTTEKDRRHLRRRLMPSRQPRQQPVTVSEKTCPGCRKTKPAEAFSKAGRMRDGLASRCKECTKASAARSAKSRYATSGDAARELFEVMNGRRRELGLTWEKLADALDYSQTRLTQMKRGEMSARLQQRVTEWLEKVA